MKLAKAALAAVFATGLTAAHAVPVSIVNPSFEADPNNAFEFYFGDPTGWTLLDPGGIAADHPALDGTDTQGTLTVTGSAYFGGIAPDGDNVAILFIGEEVGTSEFGIAQVLSATLAAGTQYSLSVEVGNIDSGPSQQFGNFDLSGFPGYRIELLAGGVVLASASAGIDAPIPEGTFSTVTLDFLANAGHAQIGQALEIRLWNLNLTDPAFPGVDLEVDFDDVRLDAAAVVAEPASAVLLALALVPLALGARRRPVRRTTTG